MINCWQTKPPVHLKPCIDSNAISWGPFYIFYHIYWNSWSSEIQVDGGKMSRVWRHQASENIVVYYLTLSRLIPHHIIYVTVFMVCLNIWEHKVLLHPSTIFVHNISNYYFSMNFKIRYSLLDWQKLKSGTIHCQAKFRVTSMSVFLCLFTRLAPPDPF